MVRGAARRTMATARNELEHLQEMEKKSFAKRGRFWERPYLQAVYKLYRVWRADRHSKSTSVQIAAICGITLRKDSHPIRIIIDCSSPRTPEKMRSRWALALRYANVKKISPSKLLEFLDEEGQGGLAGRASAFRARQRKGAAAKKAKA
jgi:DNA segregation ATPase FtsK/SpoIIIE-like protein